MRVLHINCNYMTTALHQNMIESLNNYTENSVFCPMIHGGRTVLTANSNVKSIECFGKIDRLFYYVKQAKILETVLYVYDIEEYDIIHAYTLMTDGNCAMKLSDKYNIPFVVAVRNTDINDFFRYKPYLIPRAIRIMEKASAVFFLSKAYKKTVLEKYVPIKKREEFNKKMYVIPNGINAFWLDNRADSIPKQLMRKRNYINIIYVGKLMKSKNIPIVQQAVKLLNNKGYNTTLTVVGDVIDKSVYDEVRSDPNTVYLKAVPKEKLIDIYRKNDLFCMASKYESFGLVYAEAMSQGLPVLYTKGQGFDGQFDEGAVGYSVDCFDSSDIAKKIELVIQNYEVMANNCIRLVEKFNWNKITADYSCIYDYIYSKQV